jgi:hypothetical protein
VGLPVPASAVSGPLPEPLSMASASLAGLPLPHPAITQPSGLRAQLGLSEVAASLGQAHVCGTLVGDAEPLPRSTRSTMFKSLVAGLLGCVWLVACGGKLIPGASQAEGGASNAGASNAGASNAGASNAGASNAGAPSASAGSSSTGGSFEVADTSPPCRDDNYLPCAASCGSPQAENIAGECQAGKWTCPAPYVGLETCSPDSCVMQLHSCCDHLYGKRSQPPCGSNGRFGACPSGLERDADPCVADSAQTTNCGSLSDQSCTLRGALCEANGAHCECGGGDGDGGLSWSCTFDLK